MLIAALVVAPLLPVLQDGGVEAADRGLELGPLEGRQDRPAVRQDLPAELGPAAETAAGGQGPLGAALAVEDVWMDGDEGPLVPGDEPLLLGPWARIDERGIASGNMRFGGWLRSSVTFAERVGPSELSSEVFSELDDLRLIVSSRFEGIDLVLASEASDGDPELTHAYAFGRFDNNHEWIVGRFRVPFLNGSVVDEDQLLFLDRTLIGETYDVDELGVGVRGSYPFASFSAALQNASDQARDALRGTIRTSFHLEGQAQPRTERVAELKRRPVTALTLAYTDDATLPTGDAYAVSLDFARDGHRLSVEWLDLGESLGGGQPYHATLASALDDEGLEIGVRYQDLDDGSNTQRYGAVLARSLYADLVRWQAAIEQTDSDDPALDGLGVRAGIVLSL